MSCNCAEFSAKLSRILELVQGQAARIAALEKENALQAEQIQALQEENARQNDRINGLNQRLGRVEGRVLSLEKKFEQLTNYIDRVVARLSRLEGRVSRLESRINSINQRLGRIEGRVLSLEKKLGQLTNYVDRLAAKLSKFESRLSRLEGRVNELNQRVGRVEGRVNSLEKLYGQLRSQVSRLWDKVSGLESRVNSINQRLGRVEGRVLSLEKKLGQFRSQLGRLSDKVGRLESRLGAFESRLNRLERRLAALEGRPQENDGSFWDRLKRLFGSQSNQLWGLLVGSYGAQELLKQVGKNSQTLAPFKEPGAFEAIRDPSRWKVDLAQAKKELKADIRNEVKSLDLKVNKANTTAAAASATAGTALTAATAVSTPVVVAAVLAQLATLLPTFTLANEVRRSIDNAELARQRDFDFLSKFILQQAEKSIKRDKALERRLESLKPLPDLAAIKTEFREIKQKDKQQDKAIADLSTKVETSTKLNQQQYTTLLTEIKIQRQCKPQVVEVQVPKIVEKPVPVPTPFPVTNTVTRVERVPVPTPFPVTNTVTRIVPEIVTITPDCPDPCPPCPEIPEPQEIEFPILNGAWADPGCGLDAPGKTYQYGGVGFFGLANAVEKVGEQLTDLKLALCPWLKEPSHDFQIVDCFAAQDAAVCGNEYEPPRIEIKQLKGMDYFEKLNTEIFNYLKEIKADFCKIEANADWNVNTFDEVSHLVSGIYLTFRVMNVEDPNFPRRRSNTTFYSYELPRARTDISLASLKCIEWNRGPNYFWINPEGINTKNKLISGYFENERKAKCDLQRIYNLTEFAAQGIPPVFGVHKRTNQTRTPAIGKFKIVQAALFNSETGECLKRWHSRDFVPCPNDPQCPDCPPDPNPLCD